MYIYRDYPCVTSFPMFNSQHFFFTPWSLKVWNLWFLMCFQTATPTPPPLGKNIKPHPWTNSCERPCSCLMKVVNWVHIIFACLCLFCPLVSSNHQNCETGVWTWHDSRKGLWMIKITKISVQQFLTFVKFWKCAKKII